MCLVPLMSISKSSCVSSRIILPLPFLVSSVNLVCPTKGGGGRTFYNYDCQNFKHVSTGVPVTFIQVFTGVPNFPKKIHGSKLSPSFSNDKPENQE